MHDRLRAALERGHALQDMHAGFMQNLPTETQSIEHDVFDQMEWESLVEMAPELRRNIKELHQTYNYVPSWYMDLYNLLHKGDPTLLDEEDMDPDYRDNRRMTEVFKDAERMPSLRLSTAHDSYAAGMAMLTMQPAIEATYRKMEQVRQAEEEARSKAEQLLNALRDLADAMAKAQMTESQEPGEGASDDEKSQWQEQMDAATEAVDQASQAVEDAGGELVQAEADVTIAVGNADPSGEVGGAVEQAQAEREEEAELMRAFGVEQGTLQRMDFNERSRLSERLRNNRMAQFARLLGQFRQFGAAERRRKVIHRPDAVVGVTLGGDLTRMTQTEFMRLGVPETEILFWKDYMEASLLQYELKGTEHLGRGPIIVVCDESGSMSWGSLGDHTPEAWSKAFSLALMDQARSSHRDFHYIGFSHSSEQWHTEFPKGQGSLDKIIEFTEHFYGGGTSYEEPLEKALGIVREYGERNLPKPDVVFITDGAINEMSPEFLSRWNAAKEELSMVTYGVLIGVPMSNAFDSVCNQTMTIDEMMHDPEVTRDLFRTL